MNANVSNSFKICDIVVCLVSIFWANSASFFSPSSSSAITASFISDRRGAR